MPVDTQDSRAFLAAFSIDPTRAAALLPTSQLHPFRLGSRALLLITVVDYVQTDIGRYIEFSVAIACTYGRRPAPRLLPMLWKGRYGFGQYVIDLPVSTEISVKGGKGIWGMPKHQASLDFLVDDRRISSQYDLEGTLAMRVDVAMPRHTLIPLPIGAVNYCAFRGMLMKSRIYFEGAPRFSLPYRAEATLILGDHPRVAPLKSLQISPEPVFTVYYPDFRGALDDHSESWFLLYDQPPAGNGEGLESVVNLGLSEQWPPPPRRNDSTGEPI